MFSAPKGSPPEKMDDTISPPVVALLQNQSEDNLLGDLSPIQGSPGKKWFSFKRENIYLTKDIY